MPVDKKPAEIPDGAVLAADVLDSKGDVLLAKGTKLTRAHVQLLERRAVATVSVATPEDAAGTATEAGREQLAGLLQQQEKVFSKVRSVPRMEALYQAARSHLAKGNLPPS
ncbi:MAG TPA: hypothetical protein PK280_06975 [Planctomycetota bacterium]|nr:hypothetical protein [Planctomycetota bacterium]